MSPKPETAEPIKIVCRNSDFEANLQVDVVVNNMLAISNTRLLRDYASVDVRLKKLIFIVKHWAKRRQVQDASLNMTAPSQIFDRPLLRYHECWLSRLHPSVNILHQSLKYPY